MQDGKYADVQADTQQNASSRQPVLTGIPHPQSLQLHRLGHF
jgi:hypothetical protein